MPITRGYRAPVDAAGAPVKTCSVAQERARRGDPGLQTGELGDVRELQAQRAEGTKAA